MQKELPMTRKLGMLPFILILAGSAMAQDYQSLGRAFVEDLFARRFDKVAAQFDATMAKALPADKIPAMLDQILGGLGPFKEITGTRVEEQGGFHVVLVACRFEKTPIDVSVAFDSSGRVAGLHFVPHSEAATEWRAPAYANLDRFQEREVTVGSGEWQLPGLLSLPVGTGPFPAIVLVHGSGPHDADETILSNKPFKDLAWGLSSRGVAVLRYTKRTLKYGNQIAQGPANFTVKEETIDDAAAAAVLLSKMPEIDSRHIYILGHSMGGMLAPRIAASSREISGIILMAGSTRPMEDSAVEQIRYLASLNGKMTEDGEKQVRQAEEDAREIKSPTLSPTATVTFVGAKIPGSYFLDLRRYNPAEVAAGLTIPILVLQGERDYQVTMKDFDGWKKALEGKSNARFKLYPSLTHLFMPSASPGSGLGTPMDYQKPQHVSESVISDIASWILSK
jgi:hypothetical protein